MFYIHQTSCISPQQTFGSVNLDVLNDPAGKRYLVIEPAYESIPPAVLRRMGKSVRMGVGAAMPLIKDQPVPDGIIIGTANGGKEDCVKFLTQIKEYDEGLLTPINFVQSTPNAVAAQIGLLTRNHGYNITHLHLGLAFENAMTDADMLLTEDPSKQYLLGAVDDISTYNYYFEEKGGWYKEKETAATSLYEPGSRGSLAGEATAMFRISALQPGAVGVVHGIDTLHSEDESLVAKKLADFLKRYLPDGEKIDLLLSGENGDDRLLNYYTSCERTIDPDAGIARFKHMCGEYPTASGMALWLACEILRDQSIPAHMMKRTGSAPGYKNLLIYNTYKGFQHGFILVSTIQK